MMSRHAWVRVIERLRPSEQSQVLLRMSVLEDYLRRHRPGSDIAVRVLRLGSQRNEAWSDVSNGDEVWAIVRRADVKTVMLRRSSQPSTPESMRVDRVVFL